MRSSTGYFNSGSAGAPTLRVYLNLDNLVDLRDDTIWPGLQGDARFDRLRQDGFEGVQFTFEEPAQQESNLPFCGLDRINAPEEAAPIIARHARRGDRCLTLHVGWGIEDDDAVARLVEAILSASITHDLPVFFETHRATITQDLWRTVQLTHRFPEIRFNADFSHYYCGLELVYGSWPDKLSFMEPVFARTGFLHGRIASPGNIQVALQSTLIDGRPKLTDTSSYLAHFREMWTLAMRGFLRSAKPGDELIFAPELLSSEHFYARVFPDAQGTPREESDRYAQALLLQQIARECFAEAQTT